MRVRKKPELSLATLMLPVAALLCANQGEHEKAAVLLGFSVARFGETWSGWLREWPLFACLRKESSLILGEEQFKAACQRGESMHLWDIVDNLLADFS